MLKPTLLSIICSIIIISFVSCKKEVNTNTIQFSIITKDTLIVKYYNGTDTVTHQTRLHFSTSYKLKTFDNVYIAIYGEVEVFKLYINGVLHCYTYKPLKCRDKDGVHIEYRVLLAV